MKTNGDPPCPSCGAWNPPGHRCPRGQACIDCGRPADMFVPDPDRLVLDETDMVEQAAADPAHDCALCDGCFYARAQRQQAAHSN